MLDNGAPLVVIQQLSGHAKLSTTALYAFVSITLMQKSYNQAHPSAAVACGGDFGDWYKQPTSIKMAQPWLGWAPQKSPMKSLTTSILRCAPVDLDTGNSDR